MAAGVDDELRRLAFGRPPSEEPLCDYSLEDQAAAAEAQGLAAKPPAPPPRLGETLTAVVANVALDDDGALLMVQEAKRACAGKWYLPAGRLDRGETLVTAAAREMLEETGLSGEPVTLLAVETAAGTWFRFSFLTRVTGGELKTPARADAESLQAKWIHDLEEVSLRAADFPPLVERARQTGLPVVLPSPTPLTRNLLRLVVVVKRRSTNRAHVLLAEKTKLHLPAAEIDPGRSVHSTLRRFLVDVFGADLPQHRPVGLLSVEHSPAAPESESHSDGYRLTLLIAFRPPLEEAPIIGKYVWHEPPTDVGEALLAKVADKNSTVPLRVVR